MKPALLVAAIPLLSVAVSCKKAHEVSLVAYVVGPTNDIHTVDEGNQRLVNPAALKASVMIATRLGDKRVKFCSGTLIPAESTGAAQRILTNHHCFAHADDEGKATRRILSEACTGTRVYFGYLKGQSGTATGVACKAGTLRTDFEGDLAVFSLSEPAPAGVIPLELWTGDDDATGRSAYIVHYPDITEAMEVPPDGGPRLPTAAVTTNDCKVAGLFPVAEWELDRTLPFSLRHTCDLIHGSSGSALVDAVSSTILGVNWGGIKITYDSGTRVDNVATRASYVRAFLAGETKVFAQQTEKQRTNSSGNLAATPASGDEGVPDTTEEVAEKVKTRSCGVVTVGAAGQGLPPFSLLLLLFVPFFVRRFCGRMDSHY